MISRYFKVIDLIFEVVDARCPVASRSTAFRRSPREKKLFVILNKTDLADARATKSWLSFFSGKNEEAFAVNSLRGDGLRGVRGLLKREANLLKQQLSKKGRRGRPLRVAVVGIPNTGKSSFLNQLTGRRSAATGNRPGVTKGPQWVHLPNVVSVLDTPGVFPPDMKDEDSLFKLALIGALDPENRDSEILGRKLLEFLANHYPGTARSKLGIPGETLLSLDEIAREKNFLLPNGQLDLQRAAMFLLNALQNGKLGAISLEFPD